MRTKGRWWLWAAGILVAMGLLGAGCTSRSQVLKYESQPTGGPYNLVPGMEAEEIHTKILVSVRGKGLEPANGTPQQKRLMAERAAIVDGYRKLSERIAGTIVSVYSASGNNNITIGQVTTETNAYLRGAQVNMINYKNGMATAQVKIYMEPRQVKFYHGSKMSRAILGALAGATLGTAAGSATGAALGASSATMHALGGTGGAMSIGAGAGAAGGAALSTTQ